MKKGTRNRKTNGNLKPGSLPVCISGTGPAESAGWAEALELVKNLDVHHATSPEGAANLTEPCLPAVTAAPCVRQVLC